MSNLSMRILSMLWENKGKFLSGGEIASKLSVSRNAVWKAVENIRLDGHEIFAVKSKGYCLAEDCDEISTVSISKFLDEKALDIKLIVLNEVESTSTYLKELAAKGEKGPLAVIAKRQTLGRGRLGRKFDSPRDTGLYMSMLLPCSLPASEISLITTMTAVAVCEAIEDSSNLSPAIKWVNDIFVDGKKVCGILTEASFSAELGIAEYAIIGVGINVFTPQNGFSPEIADTAGSLFGNCKFDIRSRLAGKILSLIISKLSDDPHSHIDEYRRRCFVLGKEVTVISPKDRYSALAIGIDDNCGLIVRLPNGDEKTLNSGEISVKL